MDKERVLETDVFDLLDLVPYVPSEEEIELEKVLRELRQKNIVIDEYSNEALSLIIQDASVEDFVEKLRGTAFSLSYKLRRMTRSVGTFARFLQRITMNRIVNEKFIRGRFEGLKRAYLNYFYKDLADDGAYVMAPSYEDMSRRLVGLHECVMFLKKAAESNDISDTITMDTYTKLVEISHGALSVESTSDGLFNHLKWAPPTIVQTVIKGSKWSNPQNIDNLCNSVLFVKYNTMDGVNSIVNTCLKRTKRLAESVDDFGSAIDEDSATLYMQNYGSAYMLSKMLKDVVNQGIQREINTLTINYIHKLKDIRVDK